MNKVASIYLSLKKMFENKSKWKGIGAEHLLHWAISNYFKMKIVKNNNPLQHVIGYQVLRLNNKKYKHLLNL